MRHGGDAGDDLGGGGRGAGGGDDVVFSSPTHAFTFRHGGIGAVAIRAACELSGAFALRAGQAAIIIVHHGCARSKLVPCSKFSDACSWPTVLASRRLLLQYRLVHVQRWVGSLIPACTGRTPTPNPIQICLNGRSHVVKCVVGSLAFLLVNSYQHGCRLHVCCSSLTVLRFWYALDADTASRSRLGPGEEKTSCKMAGALEQRSPV